ncbi:hypothetical protein, partial [Sulfitobacter sp.]|uniref:hypothetical protein n=1 Tax=Sulfitobacter sp. TaxID=1903071 RepID=UPI003F6B42D6
HRKQQPRTIAPRLTQLRQSVFRSIHSGFLSNLKTLDLRTDHRLTAYASRAKVRQAKFCLIIRQSFARKRPRHQGAPVQLDQLLVYVFRYHSPTFGCQNGKLP